MILSVVLLWSSSSAQEMIDTTGLSKNYYHKKSVYEVLPHHQGKIIFLGNSITEQGRWRELFENNNIINRGIGGDRTDGILYRLNEITDSKPSKVFLLIGTNDLSYGRSIEYIIRKTQQIVKSIKAESPNTKIYLQSVLPTYDRKERPIDKIKAINEGYQKIALEEEITYIDLFTYFIDYLGNMDMKYSLDGLHLNGIGYLKWKEIIESKVNN